MRQIVCDITPVCGRAVDDLLTLLDDPATIFAGECTTELLVTDVPRTYRVVVRWEPGGGVEVEVT